MAVAVIVATKAKKADAADAANNLQMLYIKGFTTEMEVKPFLFQNGINDFSRTGRERSLCSVSSVWRTMRPADIESAESRLRLIVSASGVSSLFDFVFKIGATS